MDPTLLIDSLKDLLQRNINNEKLNQLVEMLTREIPITLENHLVQSTQKHDDIITRFEFEENQEITKERSKILDQKYQDQLQKRLGALIDGE